MPSDGERASDAGYPEAAMAGALGLSSDSRSLAFASPRSAAMASSSVRRCPTRPTPKSFKSSAVKHGRTLSSIALSRNAASYCSRPRLRKPTSEVHDRARTPLLSRAPLSKGPPGQGDKTADYDAREIMSVIV